MAPGGPVEALQGYKEQGLIDFLGVASGPIDLEIKYVELGIFDAVITHNRYTLLNASADPLLTVASERGVAVLNAAPYGSGMLAKGPDAYPRYAYQQASEKMIDRVRQMAAICDRYGVPLAAAPCNSPCEIPGSRTRLSACPAPPGSKAPSTLRRSISRKESGRSSRPFHRPWAIPKRIATNSRRDRTQPGFRPEC